MADDNSAIILLLLLNNGKAFVDLYKEAVQIYPSLFLNKER
jgi:hypothetical protein